jgi:RNA polymerase sigma-70 factor (ECF subfamily)
VAGITLMADSRAAAEDAVQEAVARAWEQDERGEPIESLAAWVTRVALNLSHSRMRRIRAERRARQRMVSEPHEAPDPDARLDVVRALGALPRRQREVTVFRYYLHMDVSEIAETLGVSQGTVKTSLHRARRSMASTLRLEETGETAGSR